MQRQTLLFLLECLGALTGLTGVLVMSIQRVQPLPYMDEIFHVPQVQRYCGHDWTTWDSKITTPPGLYFFSYVLIHFVSVLVQSSTLEAGQLCSTFHLRLVNVFLVGGNFLLILLISVKIVKGDVCNRSIFNALVLSLTPVLYFFCMLYYTDQFSLLCVLFTVFLYKTERRLLCVVAAIIALLARQTNVVWIAFAVGLSLEGALVTRFGSFWRPKEKLETSVTGDTVNASPSSANEWSFLRAILNDPMEVIRLALQSVWHSLGLVLVVCGFGAFVIYNGGVTLGDKQAHVSVPHVMQVFYFCAFSSVLTAPRCMVSIVNFSRALVQSRRFIYMCLVGVVLIVVCVCLFTYEHPYLLADNRHYTFYLWARLFRRYPFLKYGFSPFYLFSIYHMWTALGDGVSPVWKLGFFLCTAACLVPAPLLEFRYFIVPFVLWRLHLPLASWRLLVAECAMYCALNVTTWYIFFRKPFIWPNEPGTLQRFMW